MPGIVVRNKQTFSFSNGLLNRFEVQRIKGADVNDFNFYASIMRCEIGGPQSFYKHVGTCNDAQIRTLAGDNRFSQRGSIVPDWDWPAHVVEPTMFQKNDRVFIFHAGDKHAFSISGRSRSHDL